jgi:hypothetical protein
MVDRPDLDDPVLLQILPGFLLSRFSIGRDQSYGASGVPNISTANAMNLAMAQCPPVYVSSRPDSSYETSRAKGKCHMSGAEKNENAATGKQRAAHDGVSIYLVNLLPKAVHVRCEPECKQYSRVDFFIFCIRGGAIKQTSKVGQIRHVNSDGYFVKRNAQCDPQKVNLSAPRAI